MGPALAAKLIIMTTKELLEKRLDKIEKELEGNRTTVLVDGWQTMRHAKKSRKWDMLAQEKRDVQDKLADLEGVECLLFN
jgi:hypothetical protein